jgi:hypothetical protein
MLVQQCKDYPGSDYPRIKALSSLGVTAQIYFPDRGLDVWTRLRHLPWYNPVVTSGILFINVLLAL